MLQAILYDLVTGETIADLTEFSTIKVSPRLSRPLTVEVRFPGDTAAIRGTFDDGFPYLQAGRRGLKALRNSALIGNTILWRIPPEGDENTTSMSVVGYDPMAQWVSRFVRDADGSIVNLTFASPISGAAILQTALRGTVLPAEDGGGGGVGPLPIDIESGQWDTVIPPAVDLAALLTSWPMRLSDLVTLLTGSRVVDVVLDPVQDTYDGDGLPVLAVVNAVNKYGFDRNGTVHFDYATGDFSISKVRRMFNMDTLCNRLYYYLGPRQANTNRYAGNITATETGAAPGSEDLSDYKDLQDASRDKYLWQYEDVRIFDDGNTENEARPMFHQLWKTEVTLRVNDRQELYLTPSSDCPFSPYDDYFVGDVVSANIADIVGPEFAGGQFRIYGFDLTQEADGPERVSEFVVSPDGL